MGRPSKKEVWQQLAKEIKAEYIEGKGFKGAKVAYHHKSWTVYLDTYTVSDGQNSTIYTRMTAPFINLKGYHFKVYKEGLFSRIRKAFGMQDIEIGYESFDDKFIVKGNNEAFLKRLLHNSDIRRLIAGQKRIKLEIKNAKNSSGSKDDANKDILSFAAAGVIKDKDRLKGLFQLFTKVLDELVDLGVTVT